MVDRFSWQYHEKTSGCITVASEIRQNKEQSNPVRRQISTDGKSSATQWILLRWHVKDSIQIVIHIIYRKTTIWHPDSQWSALSHFSAKPERYKVLEQEVWGSVYTKCCRMPWQHRLLQEIWSSFAHWQNFMPSSRSWYIWLVCYMHFAQDI